MRKGRAYMDFMDEERKTLLVIDDSPFVSKRISDIVEGRGFDVVGSEKTGEEGVIGFRKLHPDVVILDMVLPGIDGLETARQIFGIDSEARILMLSSLSDTGFINEVHNLGIRFVLSKPVKQVELLQSLNKILENA